ncbi:hypothetical protein ABTZ58_06460 [Streptomyces sp. NPDC094143]|uniref:hypothetical protein n=1 Tax=Streptomyces sp. NPDC094143 TaxID=3155310 RepID=UPI003333DB77
MTRRLCTLALNRRVDPPTEDLRLGTLAAHHGVHQVRAQAVEAGLNVMASVSRHTSTLVTVDLAGRTILTANRQTAQLSCPRAG